MLQRKLLKDLKQALCALQEKDWKSAGFNMTVWAEEKLPETPKLGCGTMCCAYGLGTTLPSWKDAGLELQQQYRYGEQVGSAPLQFMPTEDASEKLGLTQEQWKYIFSPLAYVTQVYAKNISPADVVQHIDDIFSRYSEFDIKVNSTEVA